jgi:hypothetical protein
MKTIGKVIAILFIIGFLVSTGIIEINERKLKSCVSNLASGLFDSTSEIVKEGAPVAEKYVKEGARAVAPVKDQIVEDFNKSIE